MTSQPTVVSRTFKQLEELNELIDRYRSREQIILDTLTYLMTTLKSLEGWAVFAIFPSDNATDGKTYTACVEQRFQYCARLLNYFGNAVSRRESLNYVTASNSPRDSRACDSMTSPDPSPRSTDGARKKPKQTDGTLRQQISAMSKRYIDEGATVQHNVVQYLHRCHQELLTVLQWGLSSIEELKLIIDEPMAEMLVFTVKSRMWRLLSNIGDFEEAARRVQQTMSQDENNGLIQAEQSNNIGQSERLSGSGTQDNGEEFTSTVNSLKDSGILADCSMSHGVTTDHRSGTADCQLSMSTSHNGAPGSTADRSSLGMTTDDWRSFYLKNWVMESSCEDRITSRDQGARRDSSAVFVRSERPLAGDEYDEEALMTGRSDGSTPEPPTSPRPSVLVKHPRILKDKLHRSMNLLPGLLAAVLEDSDSKSLQASWNISSTT